MSQRVHRESIVEVLKVENSDPRWKNPIWTGWLNKFTVTLGKVCWRKRYFILNSDGFLWYFKSEKAGTKPCKGHVNVAGHHFRYSNVRRNCIEIERSSKPFMMYSDKEKTMRSLGDKMKKAGGIEDCQEVWFEMEDKVYTKIHAEKLSSYRRKHIGEYLKKHNIKVESKFKSSDLKEHSSLMAYMEKWKDEKRVKFDPKDFRIPFGDVGVKGRKMESKDRSTSLFEVTYKDSTYLMKLYSTDEFYRKDRYRTYCNELSLSKYKNKNLLSYLGQTIITSEEQKVFNAANPGMIDPSAHPKIGILFEYCDPTMTLPKLLTEKKEEWTLEKKLKILQELADCLSFLNVFDWIHGEVGWGNIVFLKKEDDVLIPKLVNFGRSEQLEGKTKMVVDIKHKLFTKHSLARKRLFIERVYEGVKLDYHKYLSPEYIQLKPYGWQHEVYAFGIMIYELFTTDFNWTEPLKIYLSNAEILQEIVNKADGRGRPNIDAIVSKTGEGKKLEIEEWIVRFMKKCWSPDSKRRPSWKRIQDIITSKGAEGLEDDELEESSSEESSSDEYETDTSDESEGESDEYETDTSSEEEEDSDDERIEELEKQLKEYKRRELDLIDKVSGMTKEMDDLKNQMKIKDEEFKKCLSEMENQKKIIEDLQQQQK